MAVRIPCESTLSGGDGVCVTPENGTQVSGRVESNLEGILTVTVEDKDFSTGAEVTVTNGEGAFIGSGTLEIHSPWNVVAYSGRIAQIHVGTGDSVKAGKLLITLEDTDHTAQFESLSRQRREYESLMLELFQMYQTEEITAPALDALFGGHMAARAVRYFLLVLAVGIVWPLTFPRFAKLGRKDESA